MKGAIDVTLPTQVQEWGLPRVGARPPFHTYLAEVWRRREFIATMARFRMRASLEGNRLGMAWVVLRPILNAGIYGLIFGVLQGGNSAMSSRRSSTSSRVKPMANPPRMMLREPDRLGSNAAPTPSRLGRERA